MNVLAEQSRSLWMTEPVIVEPKLQQDIRADVLVVGSGIAGLSCAYELAQAGRDVTIIDRGAIGRGMTARTTAHLSYELDDYYAEFIKLRGEDEARQYYASQRAAVDRIEAIVMNEAIDCDFARVDAWLLPHANDAIALLEDELAACHRIGFDDVRWDVLESWGRGLRFPQQARFHPLKYLDGLTAALTRHGVKFYAESPVTEFDEHQDLVRVVTANGASVLASTVIVATNTPVSNTVTIHTKQAPYRTYAFAARAPKGANEDFVIVGGEDHKTGMEDDGAARIARLYDWARRRWPALGAIEYAWSGQVYEPVDFAPYIGRAPGSKRMFIVTGDSGEGLTTGVAASLVLRELAQGRAHLAQAVYAPDRKTLRAAGTYLKENADVVANLSEHIHDAEQFDSFDDIPSGHGGVVSAKGKKIAAYRNEQGQLTLCSATCAHVGCVVHWNSFERCWDCPCHGSQFSISGEALNGPAVRPLHAVDDATDSARSGAASGVERALRE